MKTTITSFLMLFALPIFAQVVIDQSNFPRVAGFTDNGFQASASGVAMPTEGDNQTWDYSGLVNASAFASTWYDASGDTDFPTALNFRDQQLTFQVFPIAATLYEAVDANGWYEQGRVLQESNNSISALTGGANDVLNFPAQVQQFEGRTNMLAFPVQYGGTWSDGHIERTQFELTVAGFGLSAAPGEQKRTITQTRTVVGQGVLTIPDENGDPSGGLNALLIKVERATLDSFFLGGQEAPAPLLQAFGLTQGNVTETEYYTFYMEDFANTVMNVNLDAQGAVSSVYYRPEAAALSTGIQGAQLENIGVYPNPINAGDVFTISGNTKGNTAEIVDASGRLVSSSTIAQSSGAVRIQLPTELKTGIYCLMLRNTDGQLVSTSRLLVQ